MSKPLVMLVYSKRVGSAARKAVLGYMADRAKDDGTNVYASKGRIARDTELSEASVKKAIREFIAEGLVRENGTRPCANGVTKVYALLIDRVKALPNTNPEPRHPVTPSPSNPVVPCDPVTQEPPPRHSGTPTPSPGDPKPPRTTMKPSESLRTLSARARDKPPPKQFLPPGWQPSERDWEYAEAQGLEAEQIQEIASDFRGYWSERRDAKAKRTEDGWRRTWQDNIRRKAPQYLRGSPVRRSHQGERPGYFETAANAPIPEGGESRLAGPYAPGASRRS